MYRYDESSYQTKPCSMRTKFVLAVILMAPILSHSQTSQRTLPDTLGEHRISVDKAGRILAWHEPDIPGAAYSHVSKLDSEFIKAGTRIESTTGLPLLLVTYGMHGDRLHGIEPDKFGEIGCAYLLFHGVTYDIVYWIGVPTLFINHESLTLHLRISMQSSLSRKSKTEELAV